MGRPPESGRETAKIVSPLTDLSINSGLKNESLDDHSMHLGNYFMFISRGEEDACRLS
jgi:hypothetical protein